MDLPSTVGEISRSDTLGPHMELHTILESKVFKSKVQCKVLKPDYYLYGTYKGKSAANGRWLCVSITEKINRRLPTELFTS